MWLIAALGNPGAKYAAHRHNVGFMFADELARSLSFTGWSQKFSSELCDGRIADEKIILLKPQTFMNHSGQAVGDAARFYKIPEEKVLVVHDELDLPVVKMRIKQGGGHGGHNGLRDIDRHLGKNYWRLRIGIDHPGDKDRVSGYVLSDFGKAERQKIDTLIDDLVRHMPLFFEQGHEALMTKIALLSNPPESNTPPTEEAS